MDLCRTLDARAGKYFKNLILRNCWNSVKIFSQKCSLHVGDIMEIFQVIFVCKNTMPTEGWAGFHYTTLWIILKIFSQKWFLGEP